MSLLRVEDLRTHFHTREGIVRAVDGVSFDLNPGETLGIVGESGSGKSVLNYSLLGLLPMPPARIESGTAQFEGADLLRCTRSQLRQIRGRRISMIFQDPMTALNPFMRIGKQIMEPLLLHERVSKVEALDRAVAMLKAVGIHDAERRMSMFPHEFSGGMRQRVMIAMALITRPQLLIADEPTTALDVTVQAQILRLIKQLQQEFGMAVILVTHDFGVVAGTCDRVLVMYAGRILESASTRDLFYAPRHPYTRALMASMPSVQQHGGDLYTIPGLPPDLSERIEGCPFAPRCAFAEAVCREECCSLEEVSAAHLSACVRVQRGELVGELLECGVRSGEKI
jgi:oligopeptide transport system ATP-binding protein